MEGGTRISATGMDEMWLCLSGSWASGVNQLTRWTSTRASQIPPPFVLPLRGSFKQNQSRTWVKTSTHARPNRRDFRGNSQPHLLSMCISFAPCITWVLVLDLTWLELRWVESWIFTMNEKSWRGRRRNEDTYDRRRHRLTVPTDVVKPTKNTLIDESRSMIAGCRTGMSS